MRGDNSHSLVRLAQWRATAHPLSAEEAAAAQSPRNTSSSALTTNLGSSQAGVFTLIYVTLRVADVIITEAPEPVPSGGGREPPGTHAARRRPGAGPGSGLT